LPLREHSVRSWAEVITYDRRMADAADHIGLPVSAPA